MESGILWAFLFMTVLPLTTASQKSGLIVTAPKSWIVGREEKICVSFHGIDFDVATTTKIGEQLFSQNAKFETYRLTFNQGTDGCFSMALENKPASSPATWELEFSAEGRGSGNSAYTFSETVEISVSEALAANITFIELDKPIYKPGDEVKFRVLTVQEELKPRMEQIPLVYITNPVGIRMMQWKNIDIRSSQGIGELRMQLFTDPVLGMWKVHVQTDSGHTETKAFDVKEYVLPKFEVVVTPPVYVPIAAESVQAEVCAKYTYGEPVKGNVTIDICMKRPSYMYSSNRPLTCHKITEQLNGCHKFELRIQELLSPHNEGPIRQYHFSGMYIAINASVQEEGTGITLSADVETPQLGTQLFKVEFKDMARYFKPGMPYQGKVMVTNTDGTPAVAKSVVITRGPDYGSNKQKSDTVLTGSDGVASWTWTDLELAEGEDTVMIKAKVPVDTPSSDRYAALYRDAVTMFTAKSWYSPSDSYLMIDSIQKNVDCAGQLTAHFVYSQGHSHQFYYRITTQYSIVLEGELQHIHGADGVSVEVDLPDTKWGDSNLVVYYVRHDGEIVADSAKFKIGQCIKNKVEFSFSSPEVAPGSDLDLELSASPGSLCAYGVMDKSIQLLAGYDSLTMDKVMLKVPVKSRGLTMGYVGYGDEYCEEQIQKKEEEEEEKKKEEAEKEKRQRLRAERRDRKNRGGGRRNRKPRSSPPFHGHYGAYSRYVDSSEAFVNPSMVVLSDLSLETRPCEKNDFMPPIYYDSPVAMPRPRAPINIVPERANAQPAPPRESEELSDLDETSGSPPVVDTIRSYFPETWLWGLASIGSSGTSVLPQTAPDTITEWLGHAMCTHAQDGLGIAPPVSLHTFQPFFVSFTMPYSVIREETVYMPVSVFNYLLECLVIKLELAPSTNYRLASGSAATEICVCGQEKQSHTFPITAHELGHINITVTASSVDNAVVCGNMIMSSQVGVRDTVIRELLIEPEGKEQEQAYGAFVCPEGGTKTNMASLVLPADLVADSATAHVSVMGDVMGPALSGLDKLIRLPTGCGEQTMLSFAPNVYILQYLTDTQQLTAEIEKRTLGFLQSGYQRELTYRHSDGSYSAFGTSDPSGSTWLSAFVLKSFSQATDFVEIDKDDLQKTQQWFQNNQMENGCYRHVGRIIHKSMKGGLENNDDNSPALTAYVLGAMLESGSHPAGFMISGAVDCLRLQDISDTYTVALTAYALTKWNRDEDITKDFMSRLDALKTSGDSGVYWAGSAEVETTAYALMAILASSPNPVNKIHDVMPIVSWLTAQRNPNGGFKSTQDTVVGLQALAKFAEYVYAKQGELAVKVKQTANNGELTFAINRGNQLLLQREPVSLPNNITFEVTGNGCAFVQATMKYNIEDVTSGSQPSIYIDVVPSRTQDNNCRQRDLKTCFRYEGPDENTNMALMDIKMVTGWIPQKDSVEMLKQDTKLNIKKIEIEKKNVYIYFNELLRGQLTCVEFRVEEDVVVRNARPGSVAIFDYYDQDNVFSQKPYTLRSVCGTKEELPFNNVGAVDPVDVNDIVQRRQPIPQFPGTAAPTVIEECPECYSTVVGTEELNTIFCTAANVYQGVVRRGGKVKVYKDMTKTGNEAKVKKTVTVTMDERCSCDVLKDKGQYVWMITTGSTLETTGKNKGALLLTGQDKVIPVDKNARDLTRLLRKVRRSKRCRN